MKKGELLAAASQQFTIFIISDKNFRYQQNLTDNRLSIIVLPTNQVPLVITLLPAIREILTTIQPGALIELSLPEVSARESLLRQIWPNGRLVFWEYMEII